MKIFVVSWFYMPTTTSEALVTYKLLSQSKNEYVICSASSKKWSYKKDSKLESKNIKQIIIDTDDFDEFVDKAYDTYVRMSKKEKFDAIMTRSLPPESQLVGLKIREKDKNISWIASLADPIANNPYETSDIILKNRHRLVRNMYFYAPHFFLNYICPLIKSERFEYLSRLNKLEREVLEKADIIITPNEAQAKYIMYNKEIYDKKSLIVPHSFDEKLYPKVEIKNDKFTFSFIGHSDALRTVEPIVRAVVILKELNPKIYNKIRIRLIGNIPDYIKNMVYVFFLQDVISVEEPCDYFESLKIMKSSDCLLHVDAWFDILEHGSIFFAAKIADYMGAGKPILGITSKNCPAGNIIESIGGECSSNLPYDIAKHMVNIIEKKHTLIQKNVQKYNSKNVAKEFDKELDRRIK